MLALRSLALIALLCFVPMASADLWGHLPPMTTVDPHDFGEVEIRSNCPSAGAVCEIMCHHYTTKDGTYAVGVGDFHEFGVYTRGAYDGVEWHYNGYGLSADMDCGEDG